MNQPLASMPSDAVHHPHFPTHHVHHHDPQSAARALAELEAIQREKENELRARRTHLYVGGRVLLAVLFIASGAAKIVQFGATREAMANFGLSGAAMLLTAAIAIELAGGLMLALGYKTRRAALALIAYLAVVTLAVHGDLSVDLNRTFALANLAFAGGLLMLVGHGAGTLSLDKRIERHRTLQHRA